MVKIFKSTHLLLYYLRILTFLKKLYILEEPKAEKGEIPMNTIVADVLEEVKKNYPGPHVFANKEGKPFKKLTKGSKWL